MVSLSLVSLSRALIMEFKVPLVKPRTTVDCSGLPVYDFSKLFNIEEIGKVVYGAVFTADYPFNGIDDKGQEFRVFGCFVFEI